MAQVQGTHQIRNGETSFVTLHAVSRVVFQKLELFLIHYIKFAGSMICYLINLYGEAPETNLEKLNNSQSNFQKKIQSVFKKIIYKTEC